jgi:hypothetical protein
MPQTDEAPASNEREWQEQVKRILKGELAREGVSYRELSDRLRQMGVQNIGEANLKNKISRGTFSATFFFQCLAAIGTTALFLKPVNMGTVHLPGFKELEVSPGTLDAVVEAMKGKKS